MPMTRPLPEISQYALSRFDRCGRLFELGHLQRTTWPAPDPMDENVEAKRRLAVGDMFHRLVQWHARGLEVAPLLEVLAAADGAEELRRQWDAYLASPYATPGAACWTEQTLRVTVDGLRLLVRYDRLERGEDGRWTIFDWKTGRGFEPDSAARSWQTRLYRLALAKGGHRFNGGAPIAPEAVTVVYWHVPSGEAHAFPYDSALLTQDEQALAAVADRLQTGLTDGFEPNERHCDRCVYRSRCQIDVERPAIAAAPMVWPTFKFPD
ncbi:PD-(D/E)XK nuclease superfamily protein [compost metagenome]